MESFLGPPDPSRNSRPQGTDSDGGKENLSLFSGSEFMPSLSPPNEDQDWTIDFPQPDESTATPPHLPPLPDDISIPGNPRNSSSKAEGPPRRGPIALPVRGGGGGGTTPAKTPKKAKSSNSSAKEEQQPLPSSASVTGDNDDDDDPELGSEERKHRKNLKERERRLQVNQKFEELATVLNVTRKNKSDKVSVLVAAIDQLQNLRTQVSALQSLLNQQQKATPAYNPPSQPMKSSPQIPRRVGPESGNPVTAATRRPTHPGEGTFFDGSSASTNGPSPTQLVHPGLSPLDLPGTGTPQGGSFYYMGNNSTVYMPNMSPAGYRSNTPLWQSPSGQYFGSYLFSPANGSAAQPAQGRQGFDDMSMKFEPQYGKQSYQQVRKPSPLVPWGCISPTDPTEKARYEASRAGVGVRNDTDASHVMLVPFNAVTGEAEPERNGTGQGPRGMKRSNPNQDGNAAQRVRVPQY